MAFIPLSADTEVPTKLSVRKSGEPPRGCSGDFWGTTVSPDEPSPTTGIERTGEPGRQKWPETCASRVKSKATGLIMTLSALPLCDRLASRVGAHGTGLGAFPPRRGAMNMRETAAAILQALARIVLYPLGWAALTTLSMLAVLEWFSALRFEPTIYLIPVVICAIWWGLASAVVCVLASALLWDFLFTEPLYRLEMSDPNQIVEMVLFLFVAFVTSNLGARAKNEADACRRREKEI